MDINAKVALAKLNTILLKLAKDEGFIRTMGLVKAMQQWQAELQPVVEEIQRNAMERVQPKVSEEFVGDLSETEHVGVSNGIVIDFKLLYLARDEDADKVFTFTSDAIGEAGINAFGELKCPVLVLEKSINAILNQFATNTLNELLGSVPNHFKVHKNFIGFRNELIEAYYSLCKILSIDFPLVSRPEILKSIASTSA